MAYCYGLPIDWDEKQLEKYFDPDG